jgi:hypothetical protein
VQTSDEIYTVSVNLLNNGSTDNSKFFGAQSIASKLKKDGKKLPQEHRPSLMQQLCQHASSAAGPFLKQLCLAIGLLGALYPSDPCCTLIASPTFQVLPLPAILEVIFNIPDSGMWLTDTDTKTVLSLLVQLAQHSLAIEGAAFPNSQLRCNPPQPGEAYQTMVLQNVQKWCGLPGSPLPFIQLIATPLFGALVACCALQPSTASIGEEVRTAAVEVLVEVMGGEDAEQQQQQQQQQQEEPAVLSILSALHRVHQDPAAAAIRENAGPELVAAWGKLAAMVMVKRAMLVARGSAESLGMVQLLLWCASHADMGVVEQVLEAEPFDALHEVPLEQRHPSMRDGFFMMIAEAMLQRCAFPANFTSWDDCEGDETEEEWTRFRELVARDLLGLCAQANTTDYLRRIGARPLAGAAGWQPAEAALFAIFCASDSVATLRTTAERTARLASQAQAQVASPRHQWGSAAAGEGQQFSFGAGLPNSPGGTATPPGSPHVGQHSSPQQEAATKASVAASACTAIAPAVAEAMNWVTGQQGKVGSVPPQLHVIEARLVGAYAAWLASAYSGGSSGSITDGSQQLKLLEPAFRYVFLLINHHEEGAGEDGRSRPVRNADVDEAATVAIAFLSGKLPLNVASQPALQGWMVHSVINASSPSTSASGAVYSIAHEPRVRLYEATCRVLVKPITSKATAEMMQQAEQQILGLFTPSLGLLEQIASRGAAVSREEADEMSKQVGIELNVIGEGMKMLRGKEAGGRHVAMPVLGRLWPVCAALGSVSCSLSNGAAADAMARALCELVGQCASALQEHFEQLLAPTVSMLLGLFGSGAGQAGGSRLHKRACCLTAASTLVQAFGSEERLALSFQQLLGSLSVPVFQKIEEGGGGSRTSGRIHDELQELVGTYLQLCHYCQMCAPHLLMMPSATGGAALMSSTVQLALEALGSREPGLVRAAVAFLAQYARMCRVGNEANGERAFHCGLLEQQGPVFVKVLLIGLADSLPMEAVARIADILAPLLYTPAFASGSNKQAWAHAALR